MTDQPCWLTKHQLEEASALIAIGFCYVGNVAKHFDDDEEIDFHKVSSWKEWKFLTVPGECFIDAVCNGALYSWFLEKHPDQGSPNFLRNRIEEIKKTLNSVFYSDSDTSKQLSLF